MARNGLNGYEDLAPSQKIVVFLYVFVAIWYLGWRLGTFNHDALGFSLLLYLAELYGALTAALHLFMVWRLRNRKVPVAQEGLTVDVFVPTYNEPTELVRRSVMAVQHMDYPHQTWLLDDGDRDEMRKLAAELNCRYLARKERTHAKAGNLNNALRHSKADFIAVFDADHAPKREFLNSTLGFFRDPSVAFVQTPQDFYNLDSFQHRVKWNTRGMFTEQSLFFRVIQRGKDCWNAAFFCGSCAVLRRAALEEIGGFAVGTVTEDLHTSIRIHKRGYRSVYYPKSLAFGLAPVSVGAFLMQRIRWGNGAMQVWRREDILFARDLTVAQKINYMASIMTYFDGWQKLVFYLVPAVVLFSGVLPIANVGWPFVLHLAPYYLLTYLVFEEVGRGYGHSIYIEQYNMARFAAFMRSTFGVFHGEEKFHITPKRASAEERVGQLMVPQYAVLLFNATAIAFAVSNSYAGGPLSFGALTFNVFWAGINLWLSFAVMLFSTRRPVRRRDYRFPLVLPATLVLHQDKIQAHYVLVSDLSPDGLRLSIPGRHEQISGGEITGSVYLPGGYAQFHGKVKSAATAGADGQTVVGCVVGWDRQEDVRRIETFLYGSDLQWRLLELHEESPTPLERMGLMGGRPSLGHGPQKWEWRTTLAMMQTGLEPRQMLGVATPLGSEGKQRLMTFDEIRPGEIVSLHQPSCDDSQWHSRRVVDVERIDTPISPLYLCDVVSAEGQSYATDEQKMAGAASGLVHLGTGASGATVVVGR